MIGRARIDAVNSRLSTLVETCCSGRPQVCLPLAALSGARCQIGI